MADATYQPYVYRAQGSTKFVVGSSGELVVESGGSIDIESGGYLKIANTAITASAAELNIMDGVTATAAEVNLVDNQAASVTYVIGSSTAWKKHVDLTLKDAAGTAMAGNQFVRLVILADAGGAAFLTPTAGSTLTTSTGATVCDVVQVSTSRPEISFGLTSTSGFLSLEWSDTGKAAAYLGVILPNGSLSITTAAITTTS